MIEDDTLGVQLETLLNEEYKALVTGNLDDIERCAEEKADLLEKMTDQPSKYLDTLRNCQQNLMRNQILSMSAIEGMRSALTRARDVEKVSATLRTYGANGRDTERRMSVSTSLSKRS